MAENDSVAMQQQLNLLEDVLDHIPSAIYVKDRQGYYILVNKLTSQLYQLPKEKILGKTDFDLLPLEMAEAYHQSDQNILAGEVETTEVLFPHEDGLHTYQSLKQPLLDETGQPYAVCGISTDNTKQREAEQALRTSKVLLQGIIDSIPAAVYVKDQSGSYLLANQTSLMLFNHTAVEVIGKTDYDLLPPEIAEAYFKADMHVIETEKPTQSEEVFVLPDGTKGVYNTLKFPLYNAEDKTFAVCGVSIDITAQKQAETERAELQQEIIEAQRHSIQELSTPIIPVMDQIIVMPLVGSIDSMRAQDLMQTLLRGISQQRAKIVILDITGVAIVDTGIAAHLDKTIQAARLKGAHTIVTGISDAVAETVIDLGIDWSNIETLKDLQTGLMVALNRLGFKLSRS